MSEDSVKQAGAGRDVFVSYASPNVAVANSVPGLQCREGWSAGGVSVGPGGGIEFGEVGVGLVEWRSSFQICPTDGATDGVREASQSHAFDSPRPGECRSTNAPGRRRIVWI
jgi:hypothetical protein